MKIVICSSVHFTMEIKKVADELVKRGDSVEIPYFSSMIISGKLSLEEFKKIKDEKGDIAMRKNTKEDLIKRYFNFITNSDAILVLNLDKKDVKNYIGGNTFLEMGFAHVLGKKIFLYNEVPKMGYTDEILDMNPFVINGDLSLIK